MVGILFGSIDDLFERLIFWGLYILRCVKTCVHQVTVVNLALDVQLIDKDAAQFCNDEYAHVFRVGTGLQCSNFILCLWWVLERLWIDVEAYALLYEHRASWRHNFELSWLQDVENACIDYVSFVEAFRGLRGQLARLVMRCNPANWAHTGANDCNRSNCDEFVHY